MDYRPPPQTQRPPTSVRRVAPGIDTDHAIDLIEGPIVYRYMIRGDAFDQHDLDAILDLVVAGLTRPPDTPPA